MALTNKVEMTVELPHEPGEWIRIRQPSAFMLARSSEIESIAESTAVLLEQCILAWSYPEPVTRENIEELDSASVRAIKDVLFPLEVEAERKND